MHAVIDLTGRVVVGKQVKLAVSTTAIGLTIPTGVKPNAAVITVTAQPLRWLANGDDPKADEGLIVAAFGEIVLSNYGDITRFKAIRQGGTDAQIDVLFYS